MAKQKIAGRIGEILLEEKPRKWNCSTSSAAISKRRRSVTTNSCAKMAELEIDVTPYEQYFE
ncbi:hypothetical protein [Planococcus sp. MB-3u-03]|uniref:hypothetical protein n=1 Tax=Planococcus sp. MB-3u-03 TaxID=2058136 RepID=UPI003FA711B8